MGVHRHKAYRMSLFLCALLWAAKGISGKVQRMVHMKVDYELLAINAVIKPF